MKGLLLLALALPLWGADTVPSLGIFIDFSNAPANAAIREMQGQAATLLQASGLNLRWRNLNANRGDESFDRLVVVRFKGRCVAHPPLNIAGGREPISESLTLASTIVQDGRVLPYSEVDCDQVRRSLGEKVSSLGRALGVLLAHEVQHVLQNTLRHAKAGWMKRSLDWKELTQK
jgi:hypothetical protein